MSTQDFSAEIVLIDQIPLRQSIAAECRDAMDRLETVRAEWHRFDREDRPAFVRWKAREFGALLSQARDVEVQIRDAQLLVHEVEMEMRRAFQSPQSAYERVMFRRENPESMDEEPEVTEAHLPGAAARKVSEFEQEALFQEWVQKFLGTNPDKMDDEAYSTTFEMFKSHMFRGGKEERASPKKKASEGQKGAPGAKKDQDQDQDYEQEQEESAEVDVRVKELYRRLVRRLHPDLRADGSAHVSTLWHEVQEAYAASDVARMEILLALSNIRGNELEEGTTLWQMRSVLHELTRSLGALEKTLLEAEGEDAWNFARSGPSHALRMRVERQLKFELAARARYLDVLTATVRQWKRAPARHERTLRQRQFA